MTETNEERLENMSPIGVDQEGNLLVKHEDWFWLSEQVQELEGKLEAKILLINNRWEEDRYALQEENMRLCEAFVDLKRSLSAEYAGAINKGVKHSLVNAIDRAVKG